MQPDLTEEIAKAYGLQETLKKEELLTELDILKANFTNCRAYFPYMSQHNIGAQEITTAPYYTSRGFHVTFKFDQPLNEAHISKNNEIKVIYSVPLCMHTRLHSSFQ